MNHLLILNIFLTNTLIYSAFRKPKLNSHHHNITYKSKGVYFMSILQNLVKMLVKHVSILKINYSGITAFQALFKRGLKLLFAHVRRIV